MSTPRTHTVDLHLRDNEMCKRLKDPFEASIYHMEAWLPFSEAAKLDKGNANVRPPNERKKPYRDMLETVEMDPASFHLKNRGIIYRCEKFEYNQNRKILRVVTPFATPEDDEEIDRLEPRYGVADGGHTFSIIRETLNRMNELKEKDGWVEPYVRVHFLGGDEFQSGQLEQLVEALNTSSQVQTFTLDEYRNEFDELKEALKTAHFDLSQVAFTENEERPWDIREIIQRMSCFLKERWQYVQPTNMYKSRGKALDAYTTPEGRTEFRKLYPIITEVLTLPEYIESEFSVGNSVKVKKFGKMRAVKPLKKLYSRPGTGYETLHRMDLALSLPLAAAFRELLELHEGKYRWSIDPKVVFAYAAEELYRLLVTKIKAAKSVHMLGSDTEYWTQAANIILRAKGDLLSANRKAS